jgi:AraC-like DNA-binding protein
MSYFYIEELPQHLASHSFVSEPHRHDFYLLLYVTSGNGTHTIDFKSYAVKPDTFFLMTPGQVHHWDLAKGTDGFIIFFTPEFYRMGLTESSLFEFPFFHSLAAEPYCQLVKGGDVIDLMVREMHSEFEAPNTIDLRMLRSYLDVLLLQVARNYPAPKDTGHSHEQTFRMRKLEQLIDKHFRKLKQPRDYADLMNLSASYLNTLCRQSVGKTLSDLIHERIVLEAKRLFAYSDLTVNQVASRLKFNQATYFVRFFTKQTGLTPDHFKQSLNRAI